MQHFPSIDCIGSVPRKPLQSLQKLSRDDNIGNVVFTRESEIQSLIYFKTKRSEGGYKY